MFVCFGAEDDEFSCVNLLIRGEVSEGLSAAGLSAEGLLL